MTEIVAISSSPNTVVLTGTTAGTGSAVISNLTTTDLFVGMKVSGTGIADGSIITSINSGANTATMNKNSNDSVTTSRSFTFTKTAYLCPTNPMLYVFDSALTTSRLNIAITPESTGSVVLTPLGRSTLANCTITQNSSLISLSSGNTDDLFVGQSIHHSKLQDDTTIDNILSSTSFTISKRATGTTASSQTVVLGLEYANLATTDGFKIKCYDNTSDTGVRINSWNEDTHYLFAMIHSDDFSKHHFVRVTEKLTQDVEGDAFEFEPKLGNEVANGVKFRLFSFPIPTSNHPLVIGAGIKNNPTYELHCARPLFYFFNEYLDKKNELNHDIKHTIMFKEGDYVSNATETLAIDSHFTTKEDFGTTIIDYSNFTLKTKLIDKLKEQDNPTTHTSNEGNTILDYTPFTNDACFTNARRDDNDTITDTASQDYNGQYRYVSYGYSKDKSNLSYNVIDCVLEESFGEKGSLAEIKIADPYRVLPKKIKEGDSFRVRQQVFRGDFNEFKSFGAKIATTPSSAATSYTVRTEHNLTNFLNAGDEVKVGNYIYYVSSITADFSGGTQTLVLEAKRRLETESIVSSATYTLQAEDELLRRAYNKKDKTLLTDFKGINDRKQDVFVKMLSKDFSFLYASVSNIDENKKLLTLSFPDKAYFDSDGATSNEESYHSLGNSLDYMLGKYSINLQRFDGEIEKIEEYKEDGLTQMVIIGRSNIRKLISPIINKNALFSEDIIYSSQSPYNKLTSAGANFTCTFGSQTITASTSITLATGDKIHIKFPTGMMSYVGEISLGATGTSFTLVDFPRAEGTTMAGFKESNTNYVMNKALASNAYVQSSTSLGGTSNKGLFFKSGTKLDSSGLETTDLVGTSHSTHQDALGYNINEVKRMKSDPYFQSTLESSTFDTINTLMDFEIVKTNAVGNSTQVTLAPYVPLTLGRVDINYANTNDTTFSENNLGKLTNDMSIARKHIEVDSERVLSSINEIRGNRNLHGKPIYINGKFLANIVQSVKNYETTISTTTNGNTTLTANTDNLSNGMEIVNGTHSGIPNGTTISSLGETSLTMSASATNSATDTTTQFTLPSTQTRIYLDREVGVVSLSGSTISSDSVVAMTSTEKIFVGMGISGTGIPASTTVTKINSKTKITISANATATGKNTFTFVLKAGMYVDKLRGHANEDVSVLTKATTETKESSKLTHELNFINAAHLHGAKTIGLLHPLLNTAATNNACSLLNYPLSYEQPFRQRLTSSGSAAFCASFDGTSAIIDEVPKSSQEVYGTPMYRLLNIEKGNYNKSLPKVVYSTNIQYYLETLSKIKYYASAYRFNAGYYIDGIDEHNIIGTDIMGLIWTGTNLLETYSGDAHVDYENVQNISASNPDVNTLEVPRVGQKVVASNIPSNTFVTSITSKTGSSGSYVGEVILSNNSTGNSSALDVEADYFSFDNKRIPESRGYVSCMGSKFFDMKTLEKKSYEIIELPSLVPTQHNTRFHQGNYPLVLLPPNPIVAEEQKTNTITLACDTNGNTTLDGFSDTGRLNVGMVISGTDIPTGTTITAISSSSAITMSASATGSNTADRTFTVTTNLHSPLAVKDRLEHIDSKVARMFLFSNCDLLPHSSTRKDSIMYKNANRDLTKYNVMFLGKETDSLDNEIKDNVVGNTNPITRLDSSYTSSAISSVSDSSPQLKDLKRFSIMRLTEVVYDFAFNQFDPENPPSNEQVIPSFDLPNYEVTRLMHSGVSNKGLYIDSISSKTINLQDNQNASQSAESVINTGAAVGDILIDGEGRYIGVIASFGTNSITLEEVPHKTTVKSDGVSTEHKDYTLNRAGSVPTSSSNSPLYYLKANHMQSASPNNKRGHAVVRGLATTNRFNDMSFGIHLLKSAVMRGIAEQSSGSQVTGSDLNRGNHSAGFGGDDSNETDTTWHTEVGNFAHGEGYDYVSFIGTESTNNSGLGSRWHDINLWLPINLGYKPNIFQTSRTQNRNFCNSSSPFPLITQYLDTVTSAFTTTADSINIGNYSQQQTSNLQAKIAESKGILLQNFKPVFLDRFDIEGGSGAKADIGMTGTRIAKTTKTTYVADANYYSTRIGMSMKRTFGSSTLRNSGFAMSKTPESESLNSRDYQDDADGVFYGLKPLIKLDFGYQLPNVDFTTGTRRAEAVMNANTPFIMDGAGLSDAQCENYHTNDRSGATFHYIVTGENRTSNATIPFGTAINFFTSTVSSNTYKVNMNKNALQATTDNELVVSRNFVGTKKAANNTNVHVFYLTDSDLYNPNDSAIYPDLLGYTLNPLWLSQVDLTGCYLVSEEGNQYYRDTGILTPNYNETISFSRTGTPYSGGHGIFESSHSEVQSINGFTPRYILYILSHEIDTTSAIRKHIITVSGEIPDPIMISNIADSDDTNKGCYHRMNHYQRIKGFRVMQPNHTCFYDFSPKKIRINEMSSKYTKRPDSKQVYGNINHYNYPDMVGDSTKEGDNEGVLSMYVIVDPDNQTNDGHLVVRNLNNLRNNIIQNETTKMLFSDGENQNHTAVEFIDEGDDIGYYISLESQEELLGVVSASETFTITVPQQVDSGAKRALIGSVVNIGTDSDLLINDLLEDQSIQFTLTKNETFPLIVAPNFKGVELYSAIKFLMGKKNKKLIEDSSSFSIKDDDSSFQSKLFLTTKSTDNDIFSYKRTKSSFDIFNDITVFGRFHKAVRKEMNSIKKKGLKSLQVFEEELVTQSSVDKRATELLKLHNEQNFNLDLEVGYKNMSQLKAGDIITVEILEENIARTEFLVLSIEHTLSGIMKLHLGKYIKGLEDRFAELAIENRKTKNRLNEDLIDSDKNQFNFLGKVKIKPIKTVIRKKTVTGGFTLNTFSTMLNTSASPLNIGTTTFTTLTEEEH